MSNSPQHGKRLRKTVLRSWQERSARLNVSVLIVATSDAVGKGLLKRCGNSYAIRDLFNHVPAVRELAKCSAVRSYIEPVLGPTAFAVRGILFDKVASANWLVAWHQDLTIEVNERVDTPGFGPWSVKAGVPHVQPPISILQQMGAVRIPSV